MDENQSATQHPFLQSLLNDIDQMDPELFAPTDPIRSNETVLGEVPLQLRKLYSMYKFFDRERERAMVDLKYAPQDHGIMAHASNMSHRAEVAIILFWSCCREEYQAWSKMVGLRRDWKLVDSGEADLRRLTSGGGGPRIFGIDLSGLL